VRSKKELEKIESILHSRKQELEEELFRLHHEKNDDGQVQDPGDQTISAVLENLKNTFQNNELEEYKMIMKALELIEKGEYGNCLDCKQPIAQKRLESYPNASRCVVCQEAVEDSLDREDTDGF